MIKRATKPGQVLRIPLLCDPDYQARRRDRLDEAQAEEQLFFESLDASVLKTNLEGVVHVQIRGVNGNAFAVAQASAFSAVRGNFTDATFGVASMTEIVRHGLLSIDGDDVGRPAPALYPVEQLSGDGGYGEIWPLMLFELHARIKVWSTLGETSGSPSAP